MKIGLIGNMNNNNFALMRYFRYLGADAHLLLYATDGKGSLSHFRPECDTWEIDKWQPYIHQTVIPNTPIAALDFPLQLLIYMRTKIRWLFGLYKSNASIISKKSILDAYAGYDRLIASGITPATLQRINRSLDIFYPYSSGVEFSRTGEFLVRFNDSFWINKLILSRISNLQAKGICSAKAVLNADMSLTYEALIDIGVSPINHAIPMVYDLEPLPQIAPNRVLEDAQAIIQDADFTLLHQSRLMWRNPGNYSSHAWVNENKNNDRLIFSFAELIKKRPNLKVRLLIVEYGPDLAPTKRLIEELKLNDYVYWLPKMERRELLWLLSLVSVGVGEFYDIPRMIWGGTGWEALATGKPLLQGFNFVKGEFEQIYGYPPPPMLEVRNQVDILLHLLDMADHPDKCESIGHAAKDWFNQYNGLSLAKKWLDILIS